MLHFDWCYALYDTTRQRLGELCPSTFDLSHPFISDTVDDMLHLPFLPRQNRGDLVLGRLWRLLIHRFSACASSALVK
jgi:hypothetical protein